MRRSRGASIAGLFLLVPILSAACEDRPEGKGEEGQTAPGGNAGAMDGLSRDQIRRQVQPLSPDSAHELGIIDTTVSVENPPPGSRVIPGTGQEVGPGDTL